MLVRPGNNGKTTSHTNFKVNFCAELLIIKVFYLNLVCLRSLTASRKHHTANKPLEGVEYWFVEAVREKQRHNPNINKKITPKKSFLYFSKKSCFTNFLYSRMEPVLAYYLKLSGKFLKHF